ncbi:MAG: hypothetical protein P8M87_01530 [Crocinitomicaceae bacterium]|nr:hypothetical protein [Crocinitomicaceae bacterium]
MINQTVKLSDLNVNEISALDMFPDKLQVNSVNQEVVRMLLECEQYIALIF